MQVRHRYLGCGDEPEVSILDLEQLIGELGQVCRPGHGGTVDEHRRPQLDIAMLPGVHVEHELHQRPLQTRAVTDQERKP